MTWLLALVAIVAVAITSSVVSETIVVTARAGTCSEPTATGGPTGVIEVA